MSAKSFDPACYELAEHFLKDEPYASDDPEQFKKSCRSMALCIQSAVEDWFSPTALELGAAIRSLNKEAADHPPYDNPHDPYTGGDRDPSKQLKQEG